MHSAMSIGYSCSTGFLENTAISSPIRYHNLASIMKSQCIYYEGETNPNIFIVFRSHLIITLSNTHT